MAGDSNEQVKWIIEINDVHGGVVIGEVHTDTPRGSPGWIFSDWSWKAGRPDGSGDLDPSRTHLAKLGVPVSATYLIEELARSHHKAASLGLITTVGPGHFGPKLINVRELIAAVNQVHEQCASVEHCVLCTAMRRGT